MAIILKQQLIAFLEDRFRQYDTSQAIFIDADGLPAIEATASLVTEDSPYTISVTSLSPDVNTFITNHHLSAIEDLEKIDRALLWGLFGKGKGEVYVRIDEFNLWYELVLAPTENAPGRYRVRNIDDEVFIVTASFREPDHFLQHALQYRLQVQQSGEPLPPGGDKEN